VGVIIANEWGKCQEWQSTGGGNQPAVAINRQWQSTGGGNQPAVAINQQWQSTSGGNQPAVAINQWWQSTSGGNQLAVTVETMLPLATLRCGAVSNDSGRIKRHGSIGPFLAIGQGSTGSATDYFRIGCTSRYQSHTQIGY